MNKMKVEDIRVCVLRIEGTNCEDETFQAFKELGARPEKVHIKQLLGQSPAIYKRSLEDYDVLAFPGGFSAGDYVRAGAIFAARLKSGLGLQVRQFVEKEKPVIGICNGFQILVELGLLPALDGIMTETPEAALYTNDSGRFECTPTLLKMENRGKCIFTSKMKKNGISLFPCAHAEGKLMLRDEGMLDKLIENDQIVFRYVDDKGEYAGYQWCPNGSLHNIAGICNPIGNVLGLMPHPERVFTRFTHPDFTRSDANPHSRGDGRVVFESVLDHLSKK